MTLPRSDRRYFVSSPAHRCFVALAACSALLLGACTRAAPPPRPVPAQGAVAGLKVHVKSTGNADTKALEASYSAALRWAGFVTVAAESEAQLVAELSLSLHSAARARSMAADDRARMARLAQVDLVVRGLTGELGATSVEYDYDAPVPAPALSRLTLAATQSEAVSAYAEQLAANDLRNGGNAMAF